MGTGCSKDEESLPKNSRKAGHVHKDQKNGSSLPPGSHPSKQSDVPPRKLGTASPNAAALEQRQSELPDIDAKPELRALREDCCSPAHGKLFSPWKVLVGSSDWQQYRDGAEGVQRYRAENLPSDYFGPGIYELAILCPQPKKARRRGLRLGPRFRLAASIPSRPSEDVIVVYVGKADNIRTRLQQHGRGASHLEGQVPEARANHSPSKIRSPTGKVLGVDGEESSVPVVAVTPANLGLFSQVFARGGSIMFRWKAVESKEAALSHEAALLSEYDYAWNRMDNGARRLLDIHGRLDGPDDHEGWSGRARWERWLCINLKHRAKKNMKKDRRLNASASAGGTQPIGASQTPKPSPAKAPNLVTRGSGVSPRKQGGAGNGVSTTALVIGQPGRTAKVKFSGMGSSPAGGLPVVQVCGIVTHSGPCQERPETGRKRCVAHKGRRLRGCANASPIGGSA